ncbi:Amidase domain-containing protein [Heracleum sosnowskyi]|uniref:Amidase domain-containing protein n=1 Tax=Heracleum sosnowskyi TaxID=360622 RepID=A0AAD8MER7_9APIA|nr:Amidase domain-containing protein [Heracleum sosnowskyi]
MTGYTLFLILFALPFISPGMSSEDSMLSKFQTQEISVHDIQIAFRKNQLTSRKLVEFYIREIQRLNPVLKSVLEVNPDALYQADKADQERKDKAPVSLSSIHGVVEKLRKAGAIILGKASLSEWSHYRSNSAPSGWCARGGQVVNPYVASAGPCGSSSGSAVSVAANLASVSLGTETDGSILCPSNVNSVVGIKPTVGLTSRSGVVPITPRQDTVGPICRTVADAVYVLDAIVGFDPNDAATIKSSKYIPSGGYSQFLKADGLSGKRLLITHYPGFGFSNDSGVANAFEPHLRKLRQKGAVLVYNLEIPNIVDYFGSSGEDTAMSFEFKIAINTYLKNLEVSPVRTLMDLIKFNRQFSDLEMLKQFKQTLFLASEATNGFDIAYTKAIANMKKLNRGYENMMRRNKLDAFVTPSAICSPVLAIGGHPGISVPAGYDPKGVPLGFCFGGLKGTESKLIEIAYGFEQATKFRKPPTFKP